ncbi:MULTISPECIES: LuxR C-terminal-related transcriptional regulator [Pseudomonas]|uniref:LuxR C-terminal-related transcriptional regulator n=1 Tax=Pseudomonas TaxID=286 RepID=UPI0003576054|nr:MULTISPECIES: LuxR C-terminal-related transcriptional regulator [Pseudomonas]EPJ89843.1 regulatory protein, LuxR [Pseudomonas sp. CFII64]
MEMTSREKEVLSLLLQGLTNKQIGRHLRISWFTARDHVSSLLKKNNVRNRLELMALLR